MEAEVPLYAKADAVGWIDQVGKGTPTDTPIVVDLVLGSVDAEKGHWERLEKAFEILNGYNISEENGRLHEACAKAMIAAVWIRIGWKPITTTWMNSYSASSGLYLSEQD